MRIKAVEPAFKEEWISERITYKVMLNVKAKTEQYGWMTSQNARWVTLKKSSSG